MIPPVSSTVISPFAADHTLQAFIELVYIKTANEVMVSQMASLEQALTTTKSVTDILTQIQNLHNLVQVKSKGTFPTIASLPANLTVAGYKFLASAFFGTPVKVSFSFSALSGGYLEFFARRATIISQLNSQIAALELTTPKIPPISGREDSNSLLAKLKLVLKDITPPSVLFISGGGTVTAASVAGTLISNVFQKAGIEKWIVDNYNSTGLNSTSSGAIQQNITNAITAAQSLNTTQTESVRNFLYIFEEYYKSASAVLQKIDQMIQKMASNISR